MAQVAKSSKRSTAHRRPRTHIGSDPRRAWRQWCIASVQWQERWEQFLQDAPPLPLGVLVGSRRTLSRALMARDTAEQAMHAQRPAFPEVCRDLTCGAKTHKGTPWQAA